jgi:ELWxxDGT repeat protein
MHPTSRTLLLVPAAIAFAVPAAAQYLVEDFTPPSVINPGSEPSGTVVMNGVAYFVATDLLGTELWRTDGSAGGTWRVKDVNPGNPSSNPADLTVLGGQLFFTADVPGYGRELWVSDGTAAGTQLVRDIHAVPDQASTPGSLVAFLGRVWFSAYDPVAGRELWSSDGTAAGTQRLADIAPGASGSAPTSLAVWNSRLWFVAQDSGGVELWSTDGTAAGTQRLVDLAAGAVSSSPEALTPAQGRLYFTASLGASGRELWSTNGTAAGTQLAADIVPGTGGSFPMQVTALGSLAVFTAAGPGTNREPWRSDGTPGGTFLLQDISPGATTSVPDELTLSATGSLVFFIASTASARTLWATNGSVAGTYIVDPLLANAGRLGRSLGGVAFSGRTATTGATLWASNGTDPGTAAVGGPDPSFIRAFGPNFILYRAGFNATGQELYVSDGTSAGTALVKDIAPAWASTPFSEFVDLNGSLFFSPTGAAGWTPWISDGSAPGTYELTNQVGNPTQRVLWNDAAWFVASTLQTGFELCRSDGTPAGTFAALDIVPGTGSSGCTMLTPSAGPLFFSAQTPASGRDLWGTDGTGPGTLDLGIAASGASSRPHDLTALGGRCFLGATDATTGDEPWVSDGTLAGTFRLADLTPGNGPSGPAHFEAFQGRMFFSAQAAGVGRELFVSDGTPAGTVLFADLFPGASSSHVADLVSCDSLLFFRAQASAATGTELWVSDGTAAGTAMLPQIVAGPQSPAITDMVGTNGRLFLFVDDGVHGRELWTSDGTAAGTHLVVDLMPGLGHGVQQGSLYRLPGTQTVAYVGSDGQDGLQLWRSDGTAAGTTRLGLMGTRPGSGAMVARSLTLAGDLLFFVGGVEGASGEELWAIDLPGLGAAFARSYGEGHCPGGGGIEPRIAAVGLPRLGNATFAFDLFDARPLSQAVLNFGFAAANLPIGPCRLLVAPPLASLPTIVTDPLGAGRATLAIPGDPGLAGLRLHAQFAVLDPAGALSGVAALSSGMLAHIGL